MLCDAMMKIINEGVVLMLYDAMTMIINEMAGRTGKRSRLQDVFPNLERTQKRIPVVSSSASLTFLLPICFVSMTEKMLVHTS